MRRTLFLFLWIISVSTTAQRLKYKELFPMLADMSPSEQLSALREYMSDDLDHPNANFRLALLHERYYKQVDPLTEYATAMAHAQEASIRFLKSKAVVTEQQVRSDNEYYAPIFGQLDAKGRLYAPFPLVQTKMLQGYDSAMLLQQRLPDIYRNFTRSVNQYDKAVKLFAAINNAYKSEEDIYMFYTAEFEAQLDQLAMHYDSAVFYFDQYQKLTATYPLKKYKQKLTVLDVKTYRLDGLINRMTFLEPVVFFWDYRKWSEHVKKDYQSEIVPMLEQLYANERGLNETLQRIPLEDVQPARISKELIYDLNNYDKNSLALSLLRYKAFQQEWLLRQKRIASDTAVHQKLDLYSTLIQQNRVADSLQRIAAGNVNAESTQKHKIYLDQYYSGSSGLSTYLAQARTVIDNSLMEYQRMLTQNLTIAKANTDPFVGKTLKFGTNLVPLFVSDTVPRLLEPNTFVTQMRLPGADGSMYLLGVAKPDKKATNRQVFVARISPDGKPAWLQPYNISIDSGVVDANSMIRTAVLTQEGCALLVTSAHMSRSQSINTFIYLTEKKEEKLNKRLRDTTYVRDLIYLEETNAFVMAHKGSEERQNYGDQEPISVVAINVLGDMVWRRDLTLAGTLTDIIPVRDGFVVAGNYTYLRDMSGRELRTRLAAAQANPYLIKLSSRGDVQRIVPLTSEKSMLLYQVTKVNDGSINLLATEATLENATPVVAADAIRHAMVNYELKIICSTL